MRQYLTEFIGTFFLVLTIGLTVIDGTPLAPLAIGSALMVMVYMGGHISGAHYNPAVTLAVFMRGRLEARHIAPYMGAQVLGAFAASATVYLMLDRPFGPAPARDSPLLEVFMAEFLFTFALALVVLNCATARETENNSFYGLAIGFTVMVGAFAVGPLTGAAFNPAVGLSPLVWGALVAGGTLAHLWIYLVAPLAGGAVAALVFKYQNPEDE